MLNILIPIIFLMLSCYFDYKERRIPNEITYTMFVSGSIVQIATGSIRETLIGLLVMMFLLSFFGRAFKLGGGDTKLILACGTWLGNTSPYFLFFAFLSLLILIPIHDKKTRIWPIFENHRARIFIWTYPIFGQGAGCVLYNCRISDFSISEFEIERPTIKSQIKYVKKL